MPLLLLYLIQRFLFFAPSREQECWCWKHQFPLKVFFPLINRKTLLAVPFHPASSTASIGLSIMGFIWCFIWSGGYLLVIRVRGSVLGRDILILMLPLLLLMFVCCSFCGGSDGKQVENSTLHIRFPVVSTKQPNLCSCCCYCCCSEIY